MNKTLLVALLCLGAGFVGCVDLKPKSDPARVFLLTSVIEKPTGGLAGEPGPSVGLKVTLPDYLLNGSIAVRQGENELVYSDLHRWAEPLDRALRRVIGRNLAQLLNTDRVLLEGWSRGAVDCEVELEVDAFIPSSSGEVNLAARWSVRTPAGTGAVVSKAVELQESGPAPGQAMGKTVALMSGLLGELSREIAKGVTKAAGRVSSGDAQ